MPQGTFIAAFIIPHKAILQPNIGTEFTLQFTTCFGSVHALGYNSIKSEPIWMKSGAL